MNDGEEISLYSILINEKSRELDSKRNFVFAIFALVISLLISILIFRFTDDKELPNFSFCRPIFLIDFILVACLTTWAIILEIKPYQDLINSIRERYTDVSLNEISIEMEDKKVKELLEKLNSHYVMIGKNIVVIENLIKKARLGLVLILIATGLELLRYFLHGFYHLQ